MRTLFGEIKQIGFVTRDIDRSMRYFVDLWNVGPWYVARRMKMLTRYKGLSSELDVSIGLSCCGNLEFEIIEQHNDAPSVYRDFLQATSALHVQHIAVWSDNFSSIKAEALARGWTPVLETSSVVGEACYVVHPSEPAVCVEITDRTPIKEKVRAVIRESVRTWNGQVPIHEGLPF